MGPGDSEHLNTENLDTLDTGVDDGMCEHEFQVWTKLLKDRTGMNLPVQRKSFLVTSLGLRMNEIGCNSYEEYYDMLSSGISGEIEWKFLVDRLTVHETRFFRHKSSLDIVRKYAMEKVSGKDETVRLQLWSAGCSTGQEAYTLAMVLDQALKSRSGQTYFGIVATDISAPSIKTAKQALYNQRQVEKHVDSLLLDTYFEKQADERFVITKELRNRICFAPMNIMNVSKEAIGEVDIVYCQNLLIYFDREKRFEIVNFMAELLKPGGIMILGSGEILAWKHPQMKLQDYPDSLVYKRQTTIS